MRPVLDRMSLNETVRGLSLFYLLVLPTSNRWSAQLSHPNSACPRVVSTRVFGQCLSMSRHMSRTVPVHVFSPVFLTRFPLLVDPFCSRWSPVGFASTSARSFYWGWKGVVLGSD